MLENGPQSGCTGGLLVPGFGWNALDVSTAQLRPISARSSGRRAVRFASSLAPSSWIARVRCSLSVFFTVKVTLPVCNQSTIFGVMRQVVFHNNFFFKLEFWHCWNRSTEDVISGRPSSWPPAPPSHCLWSCIPLVSLRVDAPLPKGTVLRWSRGAETILTEDDWTPLRLLHKLQRFWLAGAEVVLQLPKTSLVSSLACETCHHQSGPVSPFVQSLPALRVQGAVYEARSTLWWAILSFSFLHRFFTH